MLVTQVLLTQQSTVGEHQGSHGSQKSRSPSTQNSGPEADPGRHGPRAQNCLLLECMAENSLEAAEGCGSLSGCLLTGCELLPYLRRAWASTGCRRPSHSLLLLPSYRFGVGKAICPWQGPIKPLEHTVAQGLEIAAAGGSWGERGEVR